jgi:hypothetical protein
MSIFTNTYQNDDGLEEYRWQMEEQRERELSWRCGMNASEASNYTPSQLQAKLQSKPAQQPKTAITRGVRTLSKSFKLPGGKYWTIWDADADICPAALRGINNKNI